MAEPRRRTAVLISGRGSNLFALIEAAKAPDYPAEIVLILSDNAVAGGLGFAKEAGIRTAVVDRQLHKTKSEFEAAIDAALQSAGVELVCLAGFMRVLSKEFVERWRDRLINIHPSLLPLFPGLDTHARALAAGARKHGATVHFVRAEVDAGPIIVQGTVELLPTDTPETLAVRVLKVEHRLYPLALKLVASGRVTVSGDSVAIDGAKVDPTAALLTPSD